MGWQRYDLPEPVHIEAGKTYYVDNTPDGYAVRERESGAIGSAFDLRFERPGTITSVATFQPDLPLPHPPGVIFEPGRSEDE